MLNADKYAVFHMGAQMYFIYLPSSFNIFLKTTFKTTFVTSIGITLFLSGITCKYFFFFSQSNVKIFNMK